MDEKPLKVAMWCIPRSLSAVVCKCIAEVEDSEIFFDYYVAAVHYGPEQTIPNPQIGRQVIEPEFTYKYVKEEMEKEISGKKLYFVKDMAYGLAGKFEMIPEDYQHTFLIRDPTHVFKSFETVLKKIGMPSLKSYISEGCAYKELYDLYEYVTKVLKQKSVIIDASDLTAHPKEMMRLYCEATGIPFNESMLSWKPEIPKPIGWKAPPTTWIGHLVFGIYKEAFESTQINPGMPKPVNIKELSTEAKECSEFSISYYEKLYALRLKPQLKQ